ncbi:hypothetical protein KP79_PYT16768 [Mizuhopecten yessoensis]|uniref:Uncharacterized protein n=1 Tax=Mizuhopecten yessoensis TaxID=6573 RepID=A0A210PUS5_MIZYE|nr:hypothetical protein KP79_PYT16768 [Mizuhopecten yessoensis]
MTARMGMCSVYSRRLQQGNGHNILINVIEPTSTGVPETVVCNTSARDNSDNHRHDSPDSKLDNSLDIPHNNGNKPTVKGDV